MKQYFLKYSQFLNESLSSARGLYLDTNKISRDDFEKLVSIDPSKTKKYLDKMCEWFIKGVSVSSLEEYIKKFHRLNPALPENQRDINGFTSFDIFELILMKAESNTFVKKAITKGIEVVFENDYVQVTQPKTYEQSCILGAGTKWCTASKKTKAHWNGYTKDHLITFYYIWFKDKNLKYKRFYKIAVGVDYGGKFREIYDAEDTRMSIEEVEKILFVYKVPMDIFVSNVDIDSILEANFKKKHISNVITIIKKVPRFQTKEYFDRFMALKPDYNNTEILITGVPKFQTKEYFDRFMALYPLEFAVVDLVIKVPSFHTQDIFNNLKLSAQNMGSVLNGVKEFQSEYYFKKYMSLEPNYNEIRALCYYCQKFKDWYETNYKEQE